MFEIRATVELATFSDAVEIGALSKEYVERDLGWKYTPARVRELIKSRSKNVVVARKHRELAGFGIMSYAEQSANLDLFAVKPSYRRQGIGRQLVDWLEEVALTAGVLNTYVQVRKRNRGAIAFYEKVGYQTIDELRGYYLGRETAVVMCKSIRPLIGSTSPDSTAT